MNVSVHGPKSSLKAVDVYRRGRDKAITMHAMQWVNHAQVAVPILC